MRESIKCRELVKDAVNVVSGFIYLGAGGGVDIV